MKSNKIVCITGASSGIGKACAEIFAKHGYHLLLCARRAEKLKELTAQLAQQYQTQIHACPLDIRNAKQVQQTFLQLPEEWQNIDILINNAGLALGLENLADGNIEEWDQVIDTNLKGLLYVTKAVLPPMIKKNQGHIINIGSISGHEVYVGGAVYCATKFAVNALTKTLKKELLGTDIRISSVDPGAVETEFSEVRFKGDKVKAKAVYQGFEPLTPADIADAVYYCASRPAHINIREMIILPTRQASAYMINRKSS